MKEIHEELDNLVVSQKPFASIQAYGDFIWRMRQLYVAFEPAISKVSHQIGLPDCSQDCISAATRDCPNIAPPAAAPELSHLADGIWGYAYVMEGSALGATQLVTMAGQQLPDGTSFEFLTIVSSHAKSRWPIFVKEIDNGCEDVNAAIAAANQAFQYALEVFTKPIPDCRSSP
ncbi:biliverdin-producing heme oxygenase [Mariniblastus sp.]|nr:biliverdin-producing heme oxygenase [Mariniblastus sp.]